MVSHEYPKLRNVRIDAAQGGGSTNVGCVICGSRRKKRTYTRWYEDETLREHVRAMCEPCTKNYTRDLMGVEGLTFIKKVKGGICHRCLGDAKGGVMMNSGGSKILMAGGVTRILCERCLFNLFEYGMR